MADDGPAESDELSELLHAQRAGVQVFWICGDTKQALAERLAIVLSEHLNDGDEYQLSYNAMRIGWENHPGRKAGIFAKGRSARTELFFEYSVIVTIRERRTREEGG